MPVHVTLTTVTGATSWVVSWTFPSGRPESIVALLLPEPPQISSIFLFCALTTSLPAPAETCVPAPPVSVTFRESLCSVPHTSPVGDGPPAKGRSNVSPGSDARDWHVGGG